MLVVIAKPGIQSLSRPASVFSVMMMMMMMMMMNVAPCDRYKTIQVMYYKFTVYT